MNFSFGSPTLDLFSTVLFRRKRFNDELERLRLILPPNEEDRLSGSLPRLPPVVSGFGALLLGPLEKVLLTLLPRDDPLLRLEA